MIELIVVLLVAGIVCYGITAFPIPAMFRTIIWCVIAIALVLYLASFFGVSMGNFPRR